MDIVVTIIVVAMLVIGCYVMFSYIVEQIEQNDKAHEVCLQLGYDKIIYAKDRVCCSRLVEGTTQIIPIERIE